MDDDYTDDGEGRLDITTISTDELRAELEETRSLRAIRLREGNQQLVEFHTGVIEKIRAELKRRNKSD